MDERYSEYLKSEKWREVRQKVIERDGYVCSVCGSKEDLCVHHLTYRHIYDETMEDLVTVCTNCHRDIHEFKDMYFEAVEEYRKYIYKDWPARVVECLKKRDVSFGGDLNLMKGNNGFSSYVEKLAVLMPVENGIGDLLNIGVQVPFRNERNKRLKEVWEETRDVKLLRKLGAGKTVLRKIQVGEW